MTLSLIDPDLVVVEDLVIVGARLGKFRGRRKHNLQRVAVGENNSVIDLSGIHHLVARLVNTQVIHHVAALLLGEIQDEDTVVAADGGLHVIRRDGLDARA